MAETKMILQHTQSYSLAQAAEEPIEGRPRVAVKVFNFVFREAEVDTPVDQS